MAHRCLCIQPPRIPLIPRNLCTSACLFSASCPTHSLDCCCSVDESCPMLRNPVDCARQAPLSLAISQSLLKFMSIELVMLSNHLILCCPLFLLPSIFPRIRVFSSESTLYIRWPKYWSLSFWISPSNEYSVLISFRIDWFDFLAVQGSTL